MQLRTSNGFGTVAIDSGTNRVRGTSALANWTQVVAGYSWFSLVGDGQTVFGIQAKTPPGSSASGQWEVTLDGPYAGPTVAAAEYVIHKDFTTLRHLPLFGPGDLQTFQVWNRAMQIIDLDSGGSGASGLSIIGNPATTPTAGLPKPSLYVRIVPLGPREAAQWWLLRAGAPVAGDVNSLDEPGAARWTQVG